MKIKQEAVPELLLSIQAQKYMMSRGGERHFEQN